MLSNIKLFNRLVVGTDFNAVQFAERFQVINPYNLFIVLLSHKQRYLMFKSIFILILFMLIRK